MRPTVFFGPFIGELGWELLFWQGWVRKVCRSLFRDYHKIACSIQGREPFYPYVDEFWPLPQSFLDLNASAHGYFTDGWRRGLPGTIYPRYTLRGTLGAIRRGRWPACDPVASERPLSGPDVEPLAEALLAEYRRRLPEETRFIVPWKPNRFEEQGLEFGVFLGPGEVPTNKDPRTKRIEFSQQCLEYLEPTAAGEAGFLKRAQEDGPLIAIFPRCRLVRRPDKNWPKDRYVELIRRLREERPHWRVAILGEPVGAHFADGVPAGCLDLINVDSAHRLDIQIAALKRAVMAIGSMSGALLMALAAGAPALIWGFPLSQVRYHEENFMGSPLVYHTDPSPTVDTVLRFVRCLERMARPTGGLAEAAPFQAA